MFMLVFNLKLLSRNFQNGIYYRQNYNRRRVFDKKLIKHQKYIYTDIVSKVTAVKIR